MTRAGRPALRAVRWIAAGVLLLTASHLPPTPISAEPDPATGVSHPHVPGQVLVRWQPWASAASVSLGATQVGATRLHRFEAIDTDLLQLETMTVEQAVIALSADPRVVYAEPNYLWSLDRTPNDPLFSQLYGLENTGQTGGTPGADIAATDAWNLTTGSDAVLVGIIDTGVDANHPDLAVNMFINPGEIPGNGVDDDGNGYVDDVSGWDFHGDDPDPHDDHGHGTHVAGTIGAVGDNGIGVAGVAWTVRLLPLKFLGANGTGTTADAVEAVHYATLMGARLTNNSWGGAAPSQALRDAIAAADAAGVLFVAAAGNNGFDVDALPHFPSGYDLGNIVAVAATDDNDQLASFSNHGATTVDVAAPGVGVTSTFPGNNYGALSGTSMATPHVSGVLALVFGQFPDIGHLDARSLVLDRADPIPGLIGSVATGARVNAFAPVAVPDSTAPGPIVDLAVTAVASNWVDLTWTTTGDDGEVGRASRTEVRSAPVPIDEANFATATPHPHRALPDSAGNPDAARVDDLPASTPLWFAVRALDEFGNAGPVSNTVTATTLVPPEIAVTPQALTDTLITGASARLSLTVENRTAGTLEFTLPLPQLVTQPGVLQESVALEKGAVDTRVGTLGTGGPDGFGYRWIDSHDPLGPVFAWNDISSTGEVALAGADDRNVGPFPLGFVFPFYGSEYSEFRICSNGFVSFVDPSAPYTNQPLPGSGAPAALVAPFWDDLLVGGSGNVYFQGDGSRMVVQWDHLDAYSGGGPYTFQAVIQADGSLLFHYRVMRDPLNGATIGLQNAARSEGLQIAFNTALVHDSLTVRMRAAPQWIAATPAEGLLHGVGSEAIALDLDATGLLAGRYEALVSVLSNDPVTPRADVPFVLQVVGAPDVDLRPATLDFGPVFLGAEPVLELEVANPGTDPLTVTAVTLSDPAFRVEPGPFVVPPRSGRVLPVTFAPTQIRAYAAVLTVTSDDPDEPVVTATITASGTPAPDFTVEPASLHANLLTGQTDVQPLALHNAGGAALDWSLTLANLQVASRHKVRLSPASPVSVDTEGNAILPVGLAPPVDAVLADLSGVVILYDVQHGQAGVNVHATLVTDLTARGATVIENDQPITPAVLLGADVFWTNDAYGAAFTPDELSAITAWVSAGGGLLIHGDETLTPFNAILEALGTGIVMGGGGESGVTTAVYPHDSTEDVASIRLTAALARLSGPGVGGPLYDDPAGNLNAAWVVLLGGRAAVLAEETLADGALGGLEGNQLFGNQLMDWLAGASFLFPAPAEGRIDPGATDTVLVRFDARSLVGGRYSADLVFNTNDPLAPETVVPATLRVTGAPDLAVTPPSVAFGGVFLGFPAAADVTLENTGTDVLEITDLRFSDPRFRLGPGTPATPFTVSAGGSALLQVSAVPDVPGPLIGTLTVDSTDPDQPAVVIPLSATGIDPPVGRVSPESVLVAMTSGSVDTRAVTLSNQGGTSLEWTASLTAQASTELADLSGVVVLVDRRHLQPNPGLWSLLHADLTARGAEVRENFLPLTEDVLADVAVVMSGEMPFPFSASERSALIAHVLAGGGLLLEGDLHVENFNNLLAGLTFGVSYVEGSGAGGVTSNVHPHPTTQGVSQVFLPGPQARLSVFEPAGGFLLLADAVGLPNGAALLAGSGRVVCFADKVFVNSILDNADNRLLANQVYDWLASPGFLSVSPVAGSLAPGRSTELSLRVDAGDLFGGTYAADLRIRSNDPVGDQVVPIRVEVTGIPRLEVEPAAADFGEVFVGGQSIRRLTLSNSGTDQLILTVTPPADPSFQVVEPPSSPLELAPGASRDLDIRYTPPAPGPAESVLRLQSNDPSLPVMEVPLTGRGLVPPVAGVQPSELNEALLTGNSVERLITVSNTGGNDLIFAARVADAVGPVTVAADRDLRGWVVLWDRAHGQASSVQHSTLLDDLRSRGAEIVEPTEPWTAALLESVDLVWLAELPVPPSPDERNVMAEWVQDGGSLFLEGDDAVSRAPGNQLLTSLDAWVRVSEAPGTPGTTDHVADHPATGVAEVYLPSPGASLEEVTPATASLPPGVLVADRDQRWVGAHGRAGAGRWAVVTDEVFDNGAIAVSGNRVWGNRLMDWLAGPAFLTVLPTIGTVPSGASLTLTARFDATDLPGGDYHATIEVLTNDPLRPMLTVATALHVTGVPDLAVRPAALDFGTVFLRYPRTLRMAVWNAGTDHLTVTSLATDHPDFRLELGVLTFPLVLAPLDSAVVQVTTDPGAAGSLAANLVAHSNDPDTPVAHAPLTANAVPPPGASLDPVDQEIKLALGDTAWATFRLKNGGGSDLHWTASSAPVAWPVAPAVLGIPAVGTLAALVEGTPPPSPSRTTEVQVELRDLSGVTVLWDRSRGQPALTSWSTLRDDLVRRGASFTENFESITPQVLEGIRIVWTTDLLTPWDVGERAALADWVTDGGGLLLEGDDLASVNAFNALLDALSPGFRYRSLPGVPGITDRIGEHPSTEEVGSLELVGNTARLLLDGPSALTNENAKLGLHVRAVSGKVCQPEHGGGPAPTDTPCSAHETDGDVGVGYSVYLVAARGDPDGIGGIDFGIDYDAMGGSGVDVFGWTLCGDLQFRRGGVNGPWPAAGSANVITWDALTNCQGATIGGDGVHAVAGAFYVYAYDNDELAIVPDPVLNPPNMKVADCEASETVLSPGSGAVAAFSTGAADPGCNPCLAPCTDGPPPPPPPPSGSFGLLVEDRAGIPNAAWGTRGSGRVVAAADELFMDTRVGVLDHQRFGNQVVDWLAGPSWLTPSPSSGTVAAGEAADLTARVEPGALEPGRYAAELRVESNDPERPVVTALVRLHTFEGTQTLLDADHPEPPATALGANRPNPFAGSTVIPFALASDLPVRIQVYDVRGRRVRTVLEERMGAGEHQVRWDGTTDGGHSTAAGVYFLRFEAGSVTTVRRMLRLP